MSYASLTGVRPSGVFDELFVRSPPKVGPFVPVLSLGGSADLDAKRDVSDSFSRSETTDLVTAHGYSTAEADALLSAKRSVADSDSLLAGKVANARVLTDVPVAALFSDTIYEHPASHPVGFITGLQAALDDKVASNRVLTDVPADAKFIDKDTLYLHPESHSIGFIAGLQAALDNKVASSRVQPTFPRTRRLQTHCTPPPLLDLFPTSRGCRDNWTTRLVNLRPA